VFERVPRAARRPRASCVRRLHRRGRACRALPVAGTAAQAARANHPSRPRACARSTRRALGANDCRRAAGAHARDRRRGRAPSRSRGRSRRAHGRDARDVVRLRGVRRAASRRRSPWSTRRLPVARGLPAGRGRATRPTGDALLMRVVLVGVSHHGAPIELRERAELSREQAADLARRLSGSSGEAVCLSTCNRTELYLADETAADAERRGEAALLALEADLGPALYRLQDEAAALHLFRVAAGLDSVVPGEGEILGQVRAAYEVGSTGPILDRLFRQALYAGRKARVETAIGESPASVSSAAAALAEQVFGDLRDRKVLVVGAGKIGDLAARSLLTRGASIAWVANRTMNRGAELAARFGGDAVGLDRIEEQLASADVVISSTSAPGWILERAQVERVLPQRKGRPLFLIDLAVPRDLDPAIHELDGCYLYDIDDVQAVVAETL